MVETRLRFILHRLSHDGSTEALSKHVSFITAVDVLHKYLHNNNLIECVHNIVCFLLIKKNNNGFGGYSGCNIGSKISIFDLSYLFSYEKHILLPMRIV